ncbi:MAG: zf-HC2 protein [Edaphobacter sp.]|nr:zf-HC2 protein [Edaphobacter sp.]
MADFNQFGSAKPPQSSDAQHCAQCEAMLADALDGTLSAADQAAFDLHMVGCSSCSAMLADARRGASWMEMLKSPRPEPPAALLERILAQTCGENSSLANSDAPAHTRQANTLLGRPSLVSSSTPAMQPVPFGSAKVLPFRSRIAAAFHLQSIGHTLLQPRLAMTAAMAFFSIALTLNLTGVRLSDIHASDLKPSSIMRSCYQAKARVVRYSDNLRVVYELESRVRDLQRSTDNDNSTNAPASQNPPDTTRPNQQPSGEPKPDDQKPEGQNPNQSPDQKQARPRPKAGTSQREFPRGNLRSVGSSRESTFHPAATEALVIFLPSVLNNLQEGRLV